MNKKILVIEDNTDIRENLVEILELAGYEVKSAENGKLGVESAENDPPDLILCDVMTPVLDGYGALRILRSKPKTADIPLIFLTAKAEKTDFRYGMNLGADDYITKPFESNELLSIIALRLKRHEKFNNGLSNDPHTFVNEVKGAEDLLNLTLDRENRPFSKKIIIYAEGSIPRFLYYILKGKVKLFKTNDDGKELIICLLRPKSYFGHVALLSGGLYTESATAVEDCELIMVPKEDFFPLLNSNRDVAAKFIKALANDVASQEEQLLRLAYSSVRKRVSDALVKLSDRYAESLKEGVSMLREDIAGLAGVAKETAIRTLGDFKDEKLIEIKEGKIFVLKLEKLRNMMN